MRLAGLLAGLLQDILSQAEQDASERHSATTCRRGVSRTASVLRMLNGTR